MFTFSPLSRLAFIFQRTRGLLPRSITIKYVAPQDVLDNAEIDVYKKAFESIDVKNSGFLTKEGIKGYLHKSGEKKDNEDVIEVLEHFYKNNDVKVDFNAYLSFIALSRKMKVEEALNHAVKTFNKDTDGPMEKEHLRKSFTELGLKPSDAFLDSFVKICNTKSDGALRYKDIKDCMKLL